MKFFNVQAVSANLSGSSNIPGRTFSHICIKVKIKNIEVYIYPSEVKLNSGGELYG
jgi:hypothetical protein